MPHDLPKWQSVYTYFRAWEADDTWQRLNDELRVMVRLKEGRNAQPSVGSVDSQSVKTSRVGENISFDGDKKVKGRKRIIFVYTMGMILAVFVHGAGRYDHTAMKLLATFSAQFWAFLKVI